MIRGRDEGRRRVHEEKEPSTGLGLTWLGAMVLLNNLGKPRVETLHGSDVLSGSWRPAFALEARS